MKNVTLGDRQTDTHVNIELEFCEQNSQFKRSKLQQKAGRTMEIYRTLIYVTRYIHYSETQRCIIIKLVSRLQTG